MAHGRRQAGTSVQLVSRKGDCLMPMPELKMFFSKRDYASLDHGNMSFPNGDRLSVTWNRACTSVEQGFNLVEYRDTGAIPHGFSPRAEHGEEIIVVHWEEKSQYDGVGILQLGNIFCDAVITDALNFPLLQPAADCYPVLLFDPQKGVMASVHCGRKSTFRNILGRTVDRMWETFGCEPKNLTAHIFPGICGDCYLLEYLNDRVPSYLDDLVKPKGRLISVNLLRMLIRQLKKAGISKVIFPVDTYACTCHATNGDNRLPLFFSSYAYFHRKPGHEIPGNQALIAEMVE